MAGRGEKPAGFETLSRGILGRRGNPSNQGARLPSLRSPRDLTLGGITKRTFAPTIPTRRDKSKESVPAATSQGQRTRGTRGQDRSHRGRGRGGGRGQNLVQIQSSVFSEGPAERFTRPRGGGGSSGGSGGGGGSSASNFIPKPKVNFSFSEKADSEEEQRRLHELYRDDFVDDDSLDKAFEKDLPVTMPLRPIYAKSKVTKDEPNKLKVKKEKIENVDEKMDVSPAKNKVIVKSEPVSSSDDECGVLQKDHSDACDVKIEDKKKVHTDTEIRPRTCNDVISQARRLGHEEIFLIQLPEVLPGLPKSKDDERKPKIKQETGTGFGHDHATTSTDGQVQRETKEKTKEEKGTSLGEVSEGYIGKIQMMKSGKTRLLLGNATFNLEMGTQVGFLQDLVSLRINEDEGSGELSTLGHVKYKMVCVPDIDCLLLDAK